ncbi:unnamed protein product [Cylicocyclus nassatus]|uniref:Uncharacterized protein n=1 Tax=Cylicocyclus nassatus TaxID=53992 RepID=A0AA36GGL7_CYLNA|nr:unnamed protein product [Cylicocyclus nassatus]
MFVLPNDVPPKCIFVGWFISFEAHVNLIDEEDGLTPLIVPLGKVSPRLLRNFLQQMPRSMLVINSTVPLIWAARKGHGSRYGNWILLSAVRSGNANIVRLLLEKFADVNARVSENRTALHLVIDESFMDICDLLVKSGTKISAADNKQCSSPALRARNRRLTPILLAIPSDSRLLYRPNRLGQTLTLSTMRTRSRFSLLYLVQ